VAILSACMELPHRAADLRQGGRFDSQEHRSLSMREVLGKTPPFLRRLEHEKLPPKLGCRTATDRLGSGLLSTQPTQRERPPA
jgi:hypothetical protein